LPLSAMEPGAARSHRSNSSKAKSGAPRSPMKFGGSDPESGF
jgi:hypothetical protein